MEQSGDVAVETGGGDQEHPEAPVRRGTRAQRREQTLRALAEGMDAHCAYCGEPLAPVPSKGGRPTPYCPADSDRYGSWGAKTITCAMLDEQREIWMQVYGPDQPMTKVDLGGLRDRLADLKGALAPVHEEIAGLEQLATAELARALDARHDAETARTEAQDTARTAVADRDEARSTAEEAHARAEAATAERSEAVDRAAQADQERDQAFTDRDAARDEAARAGADRQAALEQATAAQQHITELHNTLAGERATALDRVDVLRREHEQAQQELRRELDEHHRQRLRAQADEFSQRVQADRAAADQRIGELTDRLTEATRSYADALAPLHEQIQVLTRDLADQRATATTARERCARLHGELAEVLVPDAEDAANRARSVLERYAPKPPSAESGRAQQAPETTPPDAER
ncbi:hypothetical protein OOZ19_20465 [Saccharopolyspora sp. NFXS83]|uniref:hypothetical protein n=1 Tax=Saccharopolyspora sp. NFXS83 TaxID=2993560 RepID=UPI00224AE130|nr:hypothetical protein [Saccharopolyspora sp. NFXS83]MCX2732617.1 hypothetical protein [Saccharopolyspora sp. NFXS83]